MNTLDRFVGGALLLIFVYLLVINFQGTTQILQSLAQFSTGTITALQGRSAGVGLNTGGRI